MKFHLCLLTGLLSTGLLFAMPEVVNAQLTGVGAEDFQKIEQPIAMKAAITFAGLGLIGAELWWFLFSSRQFKAQFKQYMQIPSDGDTAAVESEESLALSLNQETNRYRDEIAVKISAAYGGIQMPKGVLSTEGRVSPQFSVG